MATTTIIDVLKHVEYIIFAAKAVKLANMSWRARQPYQGDILLTKDGLHSWLLRWAIDTGRVADPGPRRPQPESAYVALVFEADREAVKAEARNYWRLMVKENEG